MRRKSQPRQIGSFMRAATGNMATLQTSVFMDYPLGRFWRAASRYEPRSGLSRRSSSRFIGHIALGALHARLRRAFSLTSLHVS